MTNLFDIAYRFAHEAHEGQTRKYTGEPYIRHPINVAGIVMRHGGSQEMGAAALLHDVLEDTNATIPELMEHFPPDVVAMVIAMTDMSDGAGNRAKRKGLERERLRLVPAIHAIKVADLMDNAISIFEHDKGFAPVFANEMGDLLKVLEKGAPAVLVFEALAILNTYRAEVAHGKAV